MKDAPTHLVDLGNAAQAIEPREADAAALLIDAAAMLAVSSGTSFDEIAGRLAHSYTMLEAAQDAVAAGNTSIN